MATTWAGTASNEAITRGALQDAIDTNVFNWYNTFIPSSDPNRAIIFGDTFANYISMNGIAGQGLNQLLVKSDIVDNTAANSVGIGGRRDGANVTVRISFSSGGISSITLNSATCTPYGSVGGPGSITITVRNASSQDIKFWLTEGGTSCPTGGTEYNSFTYTPSSRRNFLIVPVWSGGAYVLV